MKKVVLLGDSIRYIGYGARVAEMLKDKYADDITVVQPDDNGRFSYYTLRGVMLEWKEMLDGADVIHWNNGLWDECDLTGDGAFTPLDVYCDCMARIGKILKGYSRNVIFATTTPPSPDMWGHSIERIQLYNSEAVKRLSADGILIDDLFTPVAADIPEYIGSDLIHLSDKGVEMCARLVTDSIISALEGK